MDETYVKVKGQWTYLYRAVDKEGKTLDFMLSERRDEAAATAFFVKAVGINGWPEKVVIDKSESNTAGLFNMNCLLVMSGWCWLITVRRTKHLNNIIEQGHRFIKKLTRPMQTFKSLNSAAATLAGIKVAHMIRKGQFDQSAQSGFAQFAALAGYPLSYQDVVDLLEERGIAVDRSTVFRWVQKFSFELTKRTVKHLRRASVDWQVDETYIRVGGKWRYLWRTVDTNGQMVDFRLTARRDAKAVKAPAYRRVIREINQRYDPHFDSFRRIDRKWPNNRIESDHAAMKRLLGYQQSFPSLRSAKTTLSGIETIRTIKYGHIHQKQPGVKGEIQFTGQLFEAP